MRNRERERSMRKKAREVEIMRKLVREGEIM